MKPPKSVLLIGSGPIVIGQACEFDYSGTQALKVLRKNGVRTILLNPNPATIMTDPEMCDRTYLEPLTVESLEWILEKEKPEAILPTMGGQTGLNLAMEAHRSGLLRRRGVELIGASPKAIRYAEDREAFRRRMGEFGLPLPRGLSAGSLAELRAAAARLGYPLLLRTSFTLGGLGSALIRDDDELQDAYKAATLLAPRAGVMVEEFLEGWREFELEVMRDRRDNCVVVCSMENVDAMGVHTGDSVTVAPQQTLSDGEYQRMRQMAFACIRGVGVETGGANVQFAQHPKTGEFMLIEMNPRVSRSSALASKATGFPIAAIATELALGKTLDEVANDVTGRTTAAFEPALDYVVVKIPQFQFGKFDVRHPWLDTSMKSIGEAMAIGRNFCEALQKGVRSLEEGHAGLDRPRMRRKGDAAVRRHIERANPARLFYLKEGLARGMPPAEAAKLSRIHPWFIEQLARITDWERKARRALTAELLDEGKRLGFSDVQIAALTRLAPARVERMRRRRGIEPGFQEVDTCAGEFEARTPYFYSTYNKGRIPSKPPRSAKKRFVVFGSGPNRIGEGLEFDYSCVHAAQAIREAGHEAVLINSNPETVSTDYDVSTRLYFDPVGAEEVEAVLRREDPHGVILQFGGQAPLNLATKLSGWPILGTPVESIVRSEDRIEFAYALRRLGIPYPKFRKAADKRAVLPQARKVGFPILLRPSFVMGGDRIKIFRDEESVNGYLAAYPDGAASFLVDRFLNPASELDVDAVSDGRQVRLCGILEHIEPAGIHSGDSSMLYPTVNIGADALEKIRGYVERIAEAFRIRGLFNLQLALYKGQPYVLEVNARASRTIPFLSKTTGIPWAKVATRVLLGRDLRSALRPYAGGRRRREQVYYAKASAFCFYRFPGPPPALGPEMRSTGETMGIGTDPESALAKARLSAGQEKLGGFGRLYCLQDL